MAPHPNATVLRAVLRPQHGWLPRRWAGGELLDPLRPEAIADPAPTYRRLHERGGVHHCTRRDCWIVSAYDDVREALRSHDALSSAEGVTELRAALPMLLSTDRPDHARLRRLVAPCFTREAAARWRPYMEAITDEAIGRMLAGPDSDAIAHLAIPLPIKVIAGHLGIPTEDFAQFRRMSDAIVLGFNGGRAWLSTVRVTPHVLRGVHELHAYLRERVAERRAVPGDDVLSMLMISTGDGTLSDDELFWFVLLLLVAGNETTTNLIGVLLLALAEDPETYAWLRADRSLIAPVVEEALRWGSPIQGFFRTARVDFELAGTTIPARSRVLLLFAAANRDPRHYPEPDRFIADRNPTDHVAFGTGIHFCLGAHLARVEAAIVLERLVERVATIELAGPPHWTANPTLRGLAALPLRLRA